VNQLTSILNTPSRRIVSSLSYGLGNKPIQGGGILFLIDMQKIIGVYAIISQIKPYCVYIGSSIDINTRWTMHRSHLKTQRHRNSKLQRHANKYGVEDLFFIILEQFPFMSKEHLLSREQYYIDSISPWFNLSPTASSVLGIKRTDEAKKKYSISQKNKVVSAETRRKQSEAKKGIIPWNKGQKWSQDVKDNISMGITKLDKPRRVLDMEKPIRYIVQYDLSMNEMGRWIKFLPASRDTGIDRKAISRRCNLDYLKALCGYYFRFEIGFKL
jgi:group I intron endonuclease